MTQNQTEQRMLGAMLRIPFQAIVAHIDSGLQEKGFTDLRPAHFIIFQHIRPEGSRVTELAEQAQITKQSTGSLVDHLTACGYAQRLPDPTDGRAKIVCLTERGWALNNAARDRLSEIEQTWTAQLGADRMAQLKQTLQDLIALIEG
jgi:DNA-binding MarR family transcriptional regulator